MHKDEREKDEEGKLTLDREATKCFRRWMFHLALRVAGGADGGSSERAAHIQQLQQQQQQRQKSVEESLVLSHTAPSICHQTRRHTHTHTAAAAFGSSERRRFNATMAA